MPGISMGQDIGCLHMPFMKPYYPISQSWYKSHKSRVNVSKVTSLSFICSLRNHWAHPVLHQNLDIRGWPWQHFSMWWIGVSRPFALYQCILTSHSETWGGWPFFNNIKGKTVILWKTRDLPETQKFSPSWLHQRKGVMNEGDPTHPSLNSPWPAQSKASSFSLVFEVEVMNYLLLLCLHP